MIAIAAWSASPPRTASSIGVESVALVAIDLDRPERALVADDRGDDEVADPGRDRHLVGLVDMDEVGGQVVAGR